MGWRPKAKVADQPPYKKLERRGEEIYDEMYDSRSSHGYLSEIKECLMPRSTPPKPTDYTTRRLRARLDHIVAVHRSQFT